MKLFSRMPFLLYSYLTTEMLAPFFASFIIMNGVFFLVKLIPFLNFALELNIGTADFIRLFSYMLPNMLLYTIPMSSMMGIIIGFSRLSNDAEILALKASGVSMYKILPPVFALATVIALSTSYFSTKLIPVSETAMQQLTYHLMKEKVDKGIKEYQFTEALGDLVIHVGQIDKTTGEWKNVWVSDMRGQTNPAITMASTGRMISDMKQMNITILLNNGSLHRPDKKDAQIVRFAKYIINVPLQLPSQGKSSHRSTLSMTELQAAASTFGRKTKRARVMLVEYHKRLVLPVGCLILTVLGLPLGLLAGPGKKAIGIPIGLAVFIFYYVFFTAGKTIGTEGAAPVVLAMWLPNVVFFFMAIYCIRRVTHEKPLVSEKIKYLLREFYAFAFRPVTTAFMKFRQAIRSMLTGKKRLQPAPPAPLAIKGDVKNKIFHLPTCEQYNCQNCSIEFKDAEFAKNSGFSPCEYCRTLLNEYKNIRGPKYRK
jgi:lipopolysaccharide export system permease protein